MTSSTTVGASTDAASSVDDVESPVGPKVEMMDLAWLYFDVVAFSSLVGSDGDGVTSTSSSC